MAHCRQCGAQMAPEASVCPRCGRSNAEETRNLEKIEKHLPFPLWALFITGLLFFLSEMMYQISISHIYAEHFNGDLIFVSFDFTFTAYAFYFAILMFGMALAGYLSSFRAMKQGKCTRNLQFVTFGVLICSLLYLVTKIIMLA